MYYGIDWMELNRMYCEKVERLEKRMEEGK